jgi:nitroreductase
MAEGFNRFLERTIAKSQQCNRNWDLSKQIPEEDIKTMKQSVTHCSSKQNRVFYKVLYTQDRDKIEAIHNATDGFTYGLQKDEEDNYLTTTNPQVLANTLFVFAKDREENITARTREEDERGVLEFRDDEDARRDEDRAIGIAAGYLTLTANLLGYESGCCQCFENDTVKDVLGLDDDVFLMMGVGYGDKTRGRKEHHMDPSFTFPSFKKTINFERV